MQKHLTWNQRFAVIEKFQPSDEEIYRVFGVTPDELSTARQLYNVGQIVPSQTFNVDQYASVFQTHHQTPPSEKSTSTSMKPLTATKRTAIPKKRGRKGDKIKKAFAAVPSTPVPAETFATEHGISLTVLRQSKRFDSEGEGKVHVKKLSNNNGEKILHVWREM